MITINDLKPGDIIILTIQGVPHPAIYSPIPGKQGDLIQMGYGVKRSGAIKSTLSRQLQVMGPGIEVHVVRSRHLEGAAIAAQAEFWLRQGVTFDERRLADSLLQFTGQLRPSSREVNILEYLKYAARRKTLPIKSKKYPYNYSSILTLLGISLNLPSYPRLRSLSGLGQLFIDKGTSSDPERPKGFTCAGFVLACIGAVALSDEIGTVTKETGWASLKFYRRPDPAYQNYSEVLAKAKREIGADECDGPGLHDVLTDQQLKEFDLQRLTKKLTPLLADQNPHRPSAEKFFNQIKNDPDNWEYFGCLDKTTLRKDFDKRAYQQENVEILAEIQQNRLAFEHEFGPDIFRRNTCRYFHHLFYSQSEQRMAAASSSSPSHTCEKNF